MKGGWRWAAALVMTGMVWTAGCKQRGHDESERSDQGLDTPRPDGGDELPDAGTPEPDAGTPLPDAGTPVPDAGTPDAGISPITIPFPSTEGWQFFGTQHGGPQRIYGVTADEGGNIWVAGGTEGLFLLQPGATRFRRFTLEDGLRPYGFMPDGSAPPGPHYLEVISVAGGPANTVFVGYEGRPGDGYEYCENNWDGPSPDPTRYKSGDADKVVLQADGTLRVAHYDFFSGPGVVRDELRGREKLCNILRIAYDKRTQSVWFGGNHGFARGDALYEGNPTCNGQLPCSGVLEHVHPALTAYGHDSHYILLTDAYYGVALHPSGDVLFGGANRTTRFRYATSGSGIDFWRAQSMTEDVPYASNRFDLWPDKVGEPQMPRLEDRVDDNVSGMAMASDGTVWVSSFSWGLAQMTDEGQVLRRLGAPELGTSYLSVVAADPLDGSVWAGDRWNGVLFRVRGTGIQQYACDTFGTTLCASRIADIQVDTSGPRRRILVGFLGNDEVTPPIPGALGIYSEN
jgi:hypothetical protein